MPAVSISLRAIASGMSPASVWASLAPGAPCASMPTASMTASGPRPAVSSRTASGTLSTAVRELTAGRGTDAVIDAVGMEAHGTPGAKLAHTLAGLMPDAVARKLMETAASTGSPRSTPRWRSSGAAGRSRCRASTAAPPTR